MEYLLTTLPSPSSTDLLSLVDVAFDPRTGGRSGLFTYRVDRKVDEGQAVLVPIGGRPAVGFVSRFYLTHPLDLPFPESQLRSVIGPIEGLSLPRPLMDLLRHVADEYLCPLPVALGAAIPPGTLERMVSRWTLDEDRLAQIPFTLDTLAKEAVDALRAAGGSLLAGRGKRLLPGADKALKLLRAKGIVAHTLELGYEAQARKPSKMLRLSADPDMVDNFLCRQARRKPAQALVLLRLSELDSPALTGADIKSLCGVTDATIKSLLEAGLIEPLPEESSRKRRPPTPNPHQKIAIEAILDPLQAHQFREFLLFGVTGSGKTEVYLRCAAEALKAGRQVLYLVPEIALASQAVSSLRERFGNRVAVLHSELPPKERMDNWSAIRSGDAAVVLGARSALFAPLGDIGLIVVDEEHESGYKQESSPRYHSRNLARHLAKTHGCPLVLGSATPSVETYYRAEREVITLLSLPQRAASARLPEVRIEDLREGYRLGQAALLSERLIESLAETLNLGQQAILFLNRRAYSPSLICRDCGQPFRCPSCAVSLSYSRKSGRLRCHHCGYQRRPPDTCPVCSGDRIKPFGVGTEKVEEAVLALFPNAKVARLDRDVSQRRGAAEKVLADFAAGETQVLVGTQMVAKGLNFPNVTLVGVIAADQSINFPDFRASERTFQLLSQVAGRAGRGNSPGKVVIQTLTPEHRAIVCAQGHDYLSFYEQVRAEREEAGYPPFVRLVNFVVSSEDQDKTIASAKEVAKRVRSALPEAAVLGPADCALERLNGKWRRHLVVKLDPDASLTPLEQALKGFAQEGVTLVVDVDPQSLM
ncbi:MAG: primosomal protein N' [Armatimonadetes bacterium]|nr:primosomal protein N' [Armatimonadota bacterium]